MVNWNRGKESFFNPLVYNTYYLKDVIESSNQWGVNWTLWLLPKGEEKEKQEINGFVFYPGALNFRINFDKKDQIQNKGLVSSFAKCFNTGELLINDAIKKALETKKEIFIKGKLVEQRKKDGSVFLNVEIDKWSSEYVVEDEKQFNKELKEKTENVVEEDDDDCPF